MDRHNILIAVLVILVSTSVAMATITSDPDAFNASTYGMSLNKALGKVTLMDSAPQMIDGQDFTFVFSPVLLSDGTDGTFRLHARGDYSVDMSSEFLTWNIDGFVSGTASPYLGSPVITEFGYNDVEWEQIIPINGGDLIMMTSDSSITISLDLESSVNQPVLGVFNPNAFVEVELTYVPEPGTVSLLGLGSLALIRRRRK